MGAEIVTCFAAGTNIQTIDGECPVENLKLGDLLWTARDEYKPIKWIGKRHIRFAELPASEAAVHKPVLFKEGSLGDRMPHRDLVVSGPHGIALGEFLVPAGQLVNNVSILRLVDAEEVTYYHVELDTHEAIFAEGLSAETYIDVGNRGAFDNGSAGSSLTSAATFTKLCGIPLHGGPELERMRSIINNRARALFKVA